MKIKYIKLPLNDILKILDNSALYSGVDIDLRQGDKVNLGYIPGYAYTVAIVSAV